MERETQLAHARLPAVERATIHPFEDGQPGPVFYQRYAHPVGLQAERLIGELEGGPALLFPSGMAATTALVLSMLRRGRGSPWPTAATTGRSGCSTASCTAGAWRWWPLTRPARPHPPTWSGSSRAPTR